MPAVPVVRRTDQRRSETPNAVMTTLASPTLGGSGQSLWQVQMRPGQQGPRHRFDAEQVWTVLDGAARLDVSGDAVTVEAGDTIVIAAGHTRQVTASADHGVVALVTGPGDARATRDDGEDAGVPPWIV